MGVCAVTAYKGNRVIAYRVLPNENEVGCDKGQKKNEGVKSIQQSPMTRQKLEQRLAALEGGGVAIAIPAACSRLHLLASTFLAAGQHMLCAPRLPQTRTVETEGSTDRPNDERFRIADLDRISIKEQLRPETGAIYLEVLAQPQLLVPDFSAIASIASSKGIPLIVDNTAGLGGYVCRPFRHGADFILSDTRPWLHGLRAPGMILIDRGTYISDSREPSQLGGSLSTGQIGQANDSSKVKTLTENDFSQKMCIASAIAQDCGCSRDPLPVPKGDRIGLHSLSTLSLRAQRCSDNARSLAHWLDQHHLVDWVCYPGLPYHPTFKLAKQYLRHGFGRNLSFGMRSEVVVDQNLFESFRVITTQRSMDPVATCICYGPAVGVAESHIHVLDFGRQSEFQVATGIEYIDDLIADFMQAFAEAT